ncbi:LppU/SCO3897 family protein [Streptomyces boninensis]|uniref:LppU/SCO3897 family protein n=1 Tax=Streptomyces boninensis TaxID=2039455 RepID=UPI003B21CDF4
MNRPQPPYGGPPQGGGQPRPFGPQPQGPYGAPQPVPPGGVPQEQYGMPPGGVPYGTPAPPSFPQPLPPRRRRTGLIVFFAVAGGLLFVSVAMAVLAWLIPGDDTVGADAGDCVEVAEDVDNADDKAKDARVVDCGDAMAQYKVLARIEGVNTTAEASPRCRAEAPRFDTVFVAYTTNREGTVRRADMDDYALCLQELP